MADENDSSQETSSSPSNALLCGSGVCDVPELVAVCPECNGKLYVQCEGWTEDTKQPCRDGVSVNCYEEDMALDEWEQDEDEDPRGYYEVAHRWHQSEWQPVIDDVCKWVGAVEC